MNTNSFPIIIEFVSGKIFGVLRGINSINDKIVICCHAATGTRIGPQRIFVEIAQKLTERNIASFCVDMPPLGDSFDTRIYDFQGTRLEMLTQYYSKYFEIVIDYLKKQYNFKEFILLTISDGGLPIYNYAKRDKDIQKIILLSPNHQVDSIQTINIKNLRQYYNKLLKRETWIKLFKFRLNLRKIIRNILPQKTSIGKTSQNKESKTPNTIKSLLIVFGEKEQELNQCLDFWNDEWNKGYFETYSCKIVAGADHSFWGWGFKRDVVMYINDWFENE